MAEGFGLGFAGAPGCKFKPLNEKRVGLKGWLRYIIKDPRAQYVTFTKCKGKVIHKAEPMTTAIQSATIHCYDGRRKVGACNRQRTRSEDDTAGTCGGYTQVGTPRSWASSITA